MVFTIQWIYIFKNAYKYIIISFWTLAEVKRMWNGEVHAMSCQHILAVSASMLRTISMARMD